MTDIPNARITSTDVFIGEDKLPGIIEQNGVTVLPGGHDSINRVTVTFLVGEVTVEDPFPCTASG